MKLLQQKHSLAIRWLHWISFPLLSLMIWSGLLIYWANPVYRVGLGSVTLVHFFPAGFFNTLSLNQDLVDGIAIHFFVMWFFAINGIVYVTYLAVSGEWRELVPHRSSFRDAWLVTLYDLHLRKEAPPQGKYNGGQRIAYTATTLMGAGSVVTGLAIYKPAQLNALTALLGGYQMARFEHFWLMMGFVMFFFIHVVQVVKAGWPNFRSMVAGYDFVTTPSDTPGDAHDR